jgi:hypothetical protein
MNVVIKPYYALPCELETFTINGKDAYKDDFGYSTNSGDGLNILEYGCGNMKFISYDTPIEGLLEEYEITMNEYNKICEMLEAKLYVGECGWCV